MRSELRLPDVVWAVLLSVWMGAVPAFAHPADEARVSVGTEMTPTVRARVLLGVSAGIPVYLGRLGAREALLPFDVTLGLAPNEHGELSPTLRVDAALAQGLTTSSEGFFRSRAILARILRDKELNAQQSLVVRAAGIQFGYRSWCEQYQGAAEQPFECASESDTEVTRFLFQMTMEALGARLDKFVDGRKFSGLELGRMAFELGFTVQLGPRRQLKWAMLGLDASVGARGNVTDAQGRRIGPSESLSTATAGEYDTYSRLELDLTERLQLFGQLGYRGLYLLADEENRELKNENSGTSYGQLGLRLKY